MPQKSFYPVLKDVAKARQWHFIDGKDQVVGRMATKAASWLKGKHRPYFTPAVDCGDFVIITNAAKVKWTGNKIDQKEYFSHSGYAKGAHIMPLKLQMERDPRRAVYLAVKRMLDDNRFRSRQMHRLKIYKGDSHPHAPQLAGAGAEEKKAK